MPIYTRTGDKGTTSLLNKARVWKSNVRVEAYGSLDELNSVLGIILSFIEEKDYAQKKYFQKILVSIQNDLFSIGSHLANPSEKYDNPLYLKKQTRFFERKIDEMTGKMPVLRNFILPGGDIVGAYLQNARTVSRRAERRVVKLHQEEPVEEVILVYINRLSDLFFTLSRYANLLKNKKETIWTRSKV